MANHMGGADQHLILQSQFMNLVAKGKILGMKVDEMEEKILEVRKEQHQVFALHEKFFGACNLVEFICNIMHSANEEMKAGNISRLSKEWGKLKPDSENRDDCVSQLIERIQNISIQTDGTEELAQGGGAASQEYQEKRRHLQEEMELGLKFAPSLSLFEDDLINESKFLRVERTQLEDRVKRVLGSFARIKLDLQKFETDCYRLQNNLLQNSNMLTVQRRIQINQMRSEMQEIDMKKGNMNSQWQEHHDTICGLLDDGRHFHEQTNKVCDKMWFLCMYCKQLNTERLELINKHMAIKPQGRE